MKIGADATVDPEDGNPIEAVQEITSFILAESGRNFCTPRDA